MSGPLHGVLVIDLTRVLSGPFCTLMLADLGARVIKIEQPGTGDDSRGLPPFKDGNSTFYAAANRGKESIALDLKLPEDRKIFELLLQRADILVDNFRPGVMARLGYAPDIITARWPALVHGSVSGFGQTGPDRGRPAYDLIIQAMGGIMHLTGGEGGPPARVGTSLVDLGAGMFACIGILAALADKRATGRGRHVDVAMLDSQVAMLEHALMRAQLGLKIERTGARFPTTAPADAFRTRDGYLVIAATRQTMFEKMARAIGLPDLVHTAAYAAQADRVANQAALKADIEAMLITDDTAAWDAKLLAAGVPCGALRTIDDLLVDPQLHHRNMLRLSCEVGAGEAAESDGIRYAGNPIKMSGMDDPPTGRLPPKLDQDRARILAELGLTDG
jgi:CoA:oxalate CoA-transferase